MSRAKNTATWRRPRPAVLVVLMGLCGLMPAMGQTSVGVILGEPTGLSAKQWIGDRAALDVAVAWSFVNTSSLYVHVDYQHHFDDLDIDEGDLLWFAGIGGRVHLAQDVRLGARFPLGLFYVFAEVPFELFFEVAPGMEIFPEPRFNMAGGIGVRYRF